MRFRRSLLPTLVASVALLSGGLAVAGPASASPTDQVVSDPASLVNPLIGTTGAVNSFPGAAVPFGMVQWSPDTSPHRAYGGGYDYRDASTIGYSLTHLSGPGCNAMGDLPILPTTGPVPANPSAATATFSHAGEHAQAGYYALTAGGIRTELTTTQRSGIARFTFPPTAQANLLLKLSGSESGTSTRGAHLVGDRTVVGSVKTGTFCGRGAGYTIYFALTFDHPFASYGTWTGSTVHAGDDGSAGTNPNGLYVTFDATDGQPVLAKAGVSYVSTDNAQLNVDTEDPSWDFAAVQTAAHDTWNRMLTKIEVGGEDATTQQIFYTALYHAFLHPNVFSDANGQYLGWDGQVHNARPDHPHYANYSGWDVYRTQIPLLATLVPDEASDIVESMLEDYAQGGMLPKWGYANGETYVMNGDPAAPIIASAYAFGARGFDTSAALDALVTQATTPNTDRPGLALENQYGYLPVDVPVTDCCHYYGPVSTQLEYDVADFAVSRFARALGDDATADQLAARAQNWTATFNPATGFVQPKSKTGAWMPGFNPAAASSYYVEGNAYQYTPMVPFNIRGLIAAAGGSGAWVHYLDGVLAQLHVGRAVPYVDLGNEPSFEVPWEYDYAGVPWKAQAAVRRVQQQLYSATPAGEAGNDDLGTMSSWYVWSALGFYPETSGTDDLALGSPLFPVAVLHLGNGRTLRLNAPDAAQDVPYINAMSVDGRAWDANYLPSQLIRHGGTVDYDMSAQPNTGRGTDPWDAPPSYGHGSAAAIGYTASAQVAATPSGTATETVAARNLTGHPVMVQWSMQLADGLSAAETAGTLRLPPYGSAAHDVAVTVGDAVGNYPVTVNFAAEDTQLPPSVSSVVVTRPGDLTPFLNEVGISADGVANTAQIDSSGHSYSANALAAAGVTPGSTVSADGMTYTWPDVPLGQPDGVLADRQTVPMPSRPDATRLGVLGVTNSAAPGAQATFTVTYTDGTTSEAVIGFSDWTLGGGKDQPVFGNTTAIGMPYRNTKTGAPEVVGTYVFSATAALTPGKTVASVSLPEPLVTGKYHVFALALG